MPLFEARVAAGCVCDGHGDLLADDVFCLADGPRVLDCIDFSDQLRYGDVLADVAFLAMDLELLGAAELATRFLALYDELSGDRHPSTLVDYYVAFRALIRAKVSALRCEQGDEGARALATRFLDLALERLRQGRVVMVLVGGAPGTGKTTVAGALGHRRAWAVLRSDVVRKAAGRARSGRTRTGRDRRGALLARDDPTHLPRAAAAGPGGPRTRAIGRARRIVDGRRVPVRSRRRRHRDRERPRGALL